MCPTTDFLVVKPGESSEANRGGCISTKQVRKAVRAVGNEFSERPAKFPSENAVENKLKAELHSERKINVTGGYIHTSIESNKKEYVQTLCKNTGFPKVQSQINIGYSSAFDSRKESTWKWVDGIGDERCENIREYFEKSKEFEGELKLPDFADPEIDISQLREISDIGDEIIANINKTKNEIDTTAGKNKPNRGTSQIDSESRLDAIQELAKKVGEAKGNSSNGTEGTSRANLQVDLSVLRSARHPALFEDRLFIKRPKSDTEGASEETGTTDQLEFCIAGGAQFFPPSGIEHAIEIKYFKTTTKPGSGLDDKNPSWNRLQGDIKELELLQNGINSEGKFDFGVQSAHLVIVSNHHIFEGYEERKENLEKWCDDKNIHVWYIHPESAKESV